MRDVNSLAEALKGNGMIRPSLQSCTMTAFKTASNVSQNAEVEERIT